MVTKLVYGGIAAASVAGGFVLDRSIADSPYRVDKRIPDIARTEVKRGYYDDAPEPFSGSVDAAVLWGPIGGSVASLVGLATVASLTPKDRVWQHTIAGRGAIAGAVIGASMATGAMASRAILG